MAVLLDEAENFDWSTNSKMRAIIDAAYESDGAIDLVDRDGDPRKFQMFAPVAWALRGSTSDMPIAVLSRAFVIRIASREIFAAASALSRQGGVSEGSSARFRRAIFSARV
jgi:hypothetical protein